MADNPLSSNHLSAGAARPELLKVAIASISSLVIVIGAIWGLAIDPIKQQLAETARRDLTQEQFTEINRQLAEIKDQLKTKADRVDIDRVIDEINQRLYSPPRTEEKQFPR